MEREELGVAKEGTPGTERGRSVPQLGRAADGGNCDHTQTRTHARTPDATRSSACAQAWKLRPFYALSPPQYRAKSRRGSPAPARTVVRTRTLYFTHFSPSYHFPPTVQLGMRTVVLPVCPVFPALHWPPEEGQSSRPSLEIPAPSWGWGRLAGGGCPSGLEISGAKQTRGLTPGAGGGGAGRGCVGGVRGERSEGCGGGGASRRRMAAAACHHLRRLRR